MRPSEDVGTAELGELGREECLALLGAHQVGRIAVIDDESMPLVLPVNYRLADDRVVFRTAAGSKVVALQRHPVAFQIDGNDPVNRVGWSVLVQGIAHEMTEAERTVVDVQPWARGAKPMWFQIVPRRITGRRLIDTEPFQPPGGYL